MSWDVALVRIRGDFRPIAEVEEDDYISLGTPAAVRTAIRAAFPKAEWSGADWAVYCGKDFEIEFDLEGVKSANTVLLHVHGTGISGPSFLLTLPEGEVFGDVWVRWYPALVTETEAQFIPRVQEGATLVHAFAAATGRRSGEIEEGAVFVCEDGRRIPLAECTYRRLLTDMDYAKKVKAKKKG